VVGGKEWTSMKVGGVTYTTIRDVNTSVAWAHCLVCQRESQEGPPAGCPNDVHLGGTHEVVVGRLPKSGGGSTRRVLMM
jgi:hypothetical protein